jgi:hypothetical protein
MQTRNKSLIFTSGKEEINIMQIAVAPVIVSKMPNNRDHTYIYITVGTKYLHENIIRRHDTHTSFVHLFFKLTI